MKSEAKSELTVNQTSKSFGGIQAVNKCSLDQARGNLWPDRPQRSGENDCFEFDYRDLDAG